MVLNTRGSPKTDLEYLHKVVSHERELRLFGARGVGRTFSACHNLAGQMLVTPPGGIFVWFIPAYHWIHHILPMLDRVLAEYELKIDRVDSGRSTIFVGEHQVLFVVPDDHGLDRLRGRALSGFVNDLGEAEEHLNGRQVANMDYIRQTCLTPTEYT